MEVNYTGIIQHIVLFPPRFRNTLGGKGGVRLGEGSCVVFYVRNKPEIQTIFFESHCSHTIHV